MKRILITLAMIASVMVGYAQPRGGGAPRGGAPGGGPAGGAARFTAAVEAAEKDAADAKKATKLATWTKLGEAYMAAYNASAGDGWLGASAQDLTLILRNARPTSQEQVNVNGQNLTKSAYGAYNYYTNEIGNLVAMEVVRPAVPDALWKAAEAYKKAAELDPKGSKSKDLTAALSKIIDKFNDEAFSYYTLGKMADASVSFERAGEVSTWAPYNKPDGDMFYSAGYTAYEAENYSRAKTFLERCISMDYAKDGEVYAKLGETYGKLGDMDLMKKTLEDAFQKFPESQGILVSLINYYLAEQADPNRLFELISAAKAKDPNNASLYYVEGNINKELGNIDAAVKSYEKSAEVNPNYEFGYIGEGMMFYDLAVETQEKAQEELDDTKYAALVEEFELYLKSCIEPFEKAFAITKDDELKISIAEYLKNACFRFREEAGDYQAKYDKYNAIVNAAE